MSLYFEPIFFIASLLICLVQAWELEFDDPCGSLPDQDILWFYDSKMTKPDSPDQG